MPVTLALVHARVGPPINGDLYSPPSASAPAVLILHEWWGLNDQIRGFARRIAQEGFHALALDLYGGAVTTDAGDPDPAQDDPDGSPNDVGAYGGPGGDWWRTSPWLDRI